MIKMLQRKLRQWVLSVPPPPEPQSAVSSRLQMLLDSRPAVLAWQIDNGFLVMRQDFHREHSHIHYCADHQAIADYMIQTAAQAVLWPVNANGGVNTSHLSANVGYATNAKATPSYRPGVI